MSKHPLVLALALTLLSGSLPFDSARAADPPKDKPKVASMQEILDASPASDWRTLDPARTLYMWTIGRATRRWT